MLTFTQGGILTGKYNEGIPDDSRFKKSDDNFIESMRQRFGSDDWVAEIKLVKSLKVRAVLSNYFRSLSMNQSLTLSKSLSRTSLERHMPDSHTRGF